MLDFIECSEQTTHIKFACAPYFSIVEICDGSKWVFMRNELQCQRIIGINPKGQLGIFIGGQRRPLKRRRHGLEQGVVLEFGVIY